MCARVPVILHALRQVRELATKVRALLKNGEPKPYVAAELKKCVSLLRAARAV